MVRWPHAEAAAQYDPHGAQAQRRPSTSTLVSGSTETENGRRSIQYSRSEDPAEIKSEIGIPARDVSAHDGLCADPSRIHTQHVHRSAPWGRIVTRVLAPHSASRVRPLAAMSSSTRARSTARAGRAKHSRRTESHREESDPRSCGALPPGRRNWAAIPAWVVTRKACTVAQREQEVTALCDAPGARGHARPKIFN
jgi:hypothetical protein